MAELVTSPSCSLSWESQVWGALGDGGREPGSSWAPTPVSCPILRLVIQSTNAPCPSLALGPSFAFSELGALQNLAPSCASVSLTWKPGVALSPSRLACALSGRLPHGSSQTGLCSLFQGRRPAPWLNAVPRPSGPFSPCASSQPGCWTLFMTEPGSRLLLPLPATRHLPLHSGVPGGVEDRGSSTQGGREGWSVPPSLGLKPDSRKTAAQGVGGPGGAATGLCRGGRASCLPTSTEPPKQMSGSIPPPPPRPCPSQGGVCRGPQGRHGSGYPSPLVISFPSPLM